MKGANVLSSRFVGMRSFYGSLVQLLYHFFFYFQGMEMRLDMSTVAAVLFNVKVMHGTVPPVSPPEAREH